MSRIHEYVLDNNVFLPRTIDSEKFGFHLHSLIRVNKFAWFWPNEFTLIIDTTSC